MAGAWACVERLALDLPSSLSGHGLQQSPAVGRALAEWVIHGHYRTLDVSDLGFDRIAKQRPVLEKCII